MTDDAAAAAILLIVGFLALLLLVFFISWLVWPTDESLDAWRRNHDL